MDDTMHIIPDEILDLLAISGNQDGEALQLSLHAVSAAPHPNTIRIRALVNNHVLVMLLDSGSSHSFISSRMVHKLGCAKKQIRPRVVQVVNGDTIPCNSEVPTFSWWVPNVTFQQDMKVVPLGSYDAILGMDWLEKCGLMNCQFTEKWVEFHHEGKQVRLQGIVDQPADSITEAPLDQILKWDKGNDIWATILLQGDKEVNEETLPAPVQADKDILHYYPLGRRPCEPLNNPTLLNLGGGSHLKRESHPSPIRLVF
ncbi:hypothetical protein QOZ80_3BG0261070 [Eleusine coracana subsp. coracana]|nr:hypothetical protein QOZ80_3BG0261070 [Eleusine coracana subsp. coracana]